MPSNFNRGRYRVNKRIAPYMRGLQQVNRDLSKLKRMLNVEYQSLNVVLDASPDTSGTTTLLSAVGQGDGTGSRQGSKIKPFSLRIKGSIAMSTSATQSRVRLVVLQDRAGTTTQPTITSLWADVATFQEGHPTTGTPQVNSRFKILFDRMYYFNDNGKQQANVDLYKKLNGHIYFSGAANTDEGRNCIYAMIASDEATNVPVAQWTSQFKFIDN